MRDTDHKPRSAHAASAPTFDDDTEASDHEAARRASRADVRRQIQKQAAAAAAREDVHAAAERGIATPETSLPFADRIQESFGPSHDVSKIRAHVGGDAAGAMGATAFATGNEVVFDREPDLHTAAHEAAHVIQQAQGVNLYGGVGEAGDHYERHADAVADRVVAGHSAADLLGPAATGPSSRAVQMDPIDADAKLHGMPPSDALARDVSIDGEVGKRARTQHLQPGVRTGDGLVDQGLLCDAEDGPDCLLTHDQRHRLISEALLPLISTAQTNYKIAVSEARAASLAERDADVPLIALMLLDVVTAHLAVDLGIALAELRTRKIEAVAALETAFIAERAERLARIPVGDRAARLGVRRDTRPTSWTEALAKIDEKSIGANVGLAVVQGKTQAAAAEKAAINAPPSTDRLEKTSFADQLSIEADLGFQRIRTQALPRASDAELIALVGAFDVRYHSIPSYRQAVTDKIARYMASGVTKIGRHRTERHAVSDDGVVLDPGLPVMRDVRVVWQRYLSGWPTRLAYERSDGELDREAVYDSDPAGPEVPRYGDGRSRSGGGLGVSEVPETPVFVPGEFVATAVARHEAAWGSPPPTLDIDDSSFTFDPPRAAAASAIKAQRAAMPAMTPNAAPKRHAVPDSLGLLTLHPLKDSKDVNH